MRILVIDDEDMVRDVIKAILAEAGHQVVGAANGVEGLKVLESQPIDLVITDMLMPEMEGMETIVELRKAHPEKRIIAISGGGRAKNFGPLEFAEKIGADAALSKPFDAQVLLQAVGKLDPAQSAPVPKAKPVPE